MFRHIKDRSRHYKTTTELSIVRLILSIGLAIFETVWPLYMNSFGLSNSTIGFISAILVIVALIISFYSTLILEKFNEYKIFVFSLICYIITYIIIAITQNIYILIMLSTIITIVAVLRIDSFDILFRDKANNKTLNEEEGLLYSLLNIGWIIGPLIASFIMLRYGINYVFVSAAIFTTIALFILISLNMKSSNKIRIELDKNIFKNLKDYIKSKKLRIPYLVGTGVEIWWALIYIYMPLFIIESGLGEEAVGVFLSITIIPLVLLEYKVGQLSDKYGFKKFLFLGFTLFGIFGLLAFIFSYNIYFVIIILALASFAMAILEPIQNSFFFKQVKSLDEEKYYPIYATSAYMGSFIGKFAIAGVLLILPKSYAYLTISIFMFIIAYQVLKLKE